MRGLSVRNGEVVEAYPQETGVLIYRNDWHFHWAKKDADKDLLQPEFRSLNTPSAVDSLSQ